MASATVDSPSSSDCLHLDSISTVDLRLLSQSDLYSLSLCSNLSFDPLRCDDVVIPKIDRSVFNESAGSRKQTYSRLRLAPRKPQSSSSSSSIPYLPKPQSTTTDPERTENSQIISLLKDLFSANPNSDELVPIRVDYSDLVPQLPLVGIKRKRGRPRKNENYSHSHSSVAAEVEVEVEEGGANVIRDIVVYENVEDRDKESVNRNGNVVDLVGLGSLEDPYGVELQRRTGNLRTAEELLGFLKGLNGQWGSRRKKKKIVDASEFGDALPKGWKLLLSLKKKEGRVWIFVRRYISPNGRQFVSCKEVSSYLLSFSGLQDANQPNFGQSSENIHLAYKMAGENAADLAVTEINKREDLVCYSPSVITCVSNDDDNQLTPELGNSREIQMGEILKCNKCTMTFNEKDDLLHHHLSSHRRKRSRFGTSITDGVIIKGGQYECQFCHKTFNERNRYNGHVGAHKRHHMKSDEASPGVLAFQIIVDPISSGGDPPMDSMMQTCTGDDHNATTVNAKADSESKSVFPQSKFKAGSDIESYNDRASHEVNVSSHDEEDLKSNRNERNFAEESCVEHDKDYQMNNCLGKADEDNDVIDAKFNFCLDSEVALTDNETNGNGEITANRIIDHPVESYQCSPFANEKICAETNMNRDVSVEDPKPESGSETVLLAPSDNGKTCSVGNMEDVHFTSPVEMCTLDTEKFDSKLIHGFGSKHDGPDEDVTEGKQQIDSRCYSSVPVSNDKDSGDSDIVNEISTSELAESKQKKGSESSGEETCAIKGIYNGSTSSASKPKFDATYNSWNEEVMVNCGGGGHSKMDADAITGVEGDYSKNCLSVPFWKGMEDGAIKEHVQDRGSESSLYILSGYEQTCGVKNDDVNISARNMEEPKLDEVQTYRNNELVSACTAEDCGQERGSENSMHILSGYEQTCSVKKDVGNIFTRKLEEPKLDEVQTYRNNELAFGISHHRLNIQETSPEFGSLVLSGNEQTFVEENITGVCSSTEELHKKKGSFDFGLLTQSCTGKTFTDVYSMNRVSTSSIEEYKPNEARNSNNELILAFDNNNTGIVADVMNTVPIEQTFSFETNLSGEISRTGKHPKQGSSLLGLSCFGKTCADGNDLNRVHTGRGWEGLMVDEVVNSGHDKLTVSFGGSNVQSDGHIMPGGMWRTDEVNVLQSPVDSLTQQEHSSSFFPTFSIISDKGENDLLGVNGKYDSMSGFEGAQTGHTDHVEFSFLTAPNLNSLPGESKALSYNSEMGQGFDPSFWLEKDALSLNIAPRNQVTSLCVWCRNEFHHEPEHSGTQAGAIGSMCPICSARVSQQYNFF